MLNLSCIIGLKVLAIKGIKIRKNQKDIDDDYIFFDDRKTYIYLEEQDYYDYHDCSYSAKELRIYHDAEEWERMFNMLVDANNFENGGW